MVLFNSNRLGKLLIMDKMLVILGMMSFWIFSPDHVIIVAFLLIIPYLLITNRISFFNHFLVAFALSLLWIFIANGKYEYSYNYAVIFGLNIFPVFAWSIGLFTLYLIYSYYEFMSDRKYSAKKFLFFTVLYWVLLLSAESIAYHIFNIQNIRNAIYPGLPICNCLHAPFWMQVAYLIMGPLYFFICSLFNLENPHKVAHVKSQAVEYADLKQPSSQKTQ